MMTLLFFYVFISSIIGLWIKDELKEDEECSVPDNIFGTLLVIYITNIWLPFFLILYIIKIYKVSTRNK